MVTDYMGMRVVITPNAVDEYWYCPLPKPSRHRSRRLWKKLTRGTRGDPWIRLLARREPAAYTLQGKLYVHPDLESRLRSIIKPVPQAQWKHLSGINMSNVINLATT